MDGTILAETRRYRRLTCGKPPMALAPVYLPDIVTLRPPGALARQFCSDYLRLKRGCFYSGERRSILLAGLGRRNATANSVAGSSDAHGAESRGSSGAGIGTKGSTWPE